MTVLQQRSVTAPLVGDVQGWREAGRALREQFESDLREMGLEPGEAPALPPGVQGEIVGRCRLVCLWGRVLPEPAGYVLQVSTLVAEGGDR